MKHTLTLFAVLLLAPLAAPHAAPSQDSRIIIASEAGAKLDSDVTKGGGTDDTAPIQGIQPDAKIDRLRIEDLNVYDPRKEIGHTPRIRADGRIALLQVRDVVVQRPQATAPAGSLIGTSMDRSALKAFMDARAGIVTPPGKGRRGLPEGPGYFTMQPQIQRLQISDVAAEGLEHVLNHQAGTIEALDLRELPVIETTKTVHLTGEAKINQTWPSTSKGNMP